MEDVKPEVRIAEEHIVGTLYVHGYDVIVVGTKGQCIKIARIPHGVVMTAQGMEALYKAWMGSRRVPLDADVARTVLFEDALTR